MISSYIENGHEYIKVFRSKTVFENQLRIMIDDYYYYYADDCNWKSRTALNIGDMVLFNNGIDCHRPIGIGTISVVSDKALSFNEEGKWQRVKGQNIEYSYNSFEVQYQVMKANGELICFNPIKVFATLDNVKKYLNMLLVGKKELLSYNEKIREAEEDFRIHGSYDMLYVRPYEGDE